MMRIGIKEGGDMDNGEEYPLNGELAAPIDNMDEQLDHLSHARNTNRRHLTHS